MMLSNVVNVAFILIRVFFSMLQSNAKQDILQTDELICLAVSDGMMWYVANGYSH
jgi:hypothetical protein